MRNDNGIGYRRPEVQDGRKDGVLLLYAIVACKQEKFFRSSVRSLISELSELYLSALCLDSVAL